MTKRKSRRLATTRKPSNSKWPSWASWREISPSSEKYRKLDRAKEDLWLRMKAFQLAADLVSEALKKCLTKNCTIVSDTSALLRRCGPNKDDQEINNGMETHSAAVVSETPSPSSCWKKFLIQEQEPSFTTTLPILLIEAPLEERDRELWMDHICGELRCTIADGHEVGKSIERRQIFVFETLEELNEHRSVHTEQFKSIIYIVKVVRSARLFANCIQGMAVGLRRPTCLVALRPPWLSLDEERWSTDVYVKTCVLPPTDHIIATFWQQLASMDFPLAIAEDCNSTGSSISATMESVRRSIANTLALSGSFWAALPILPKSLIRRARSIHRRRTVVHMLPAIGCLPNEWNEMTKKILIERLVHRFKALPIEVQVTAKQSLFCSILWIDRLQSRQQLVRLVLPQHDGDQAQPRRETVRALLDTAVGEQWMGGSEMDAYGMRHLAVCGLGRILKNGTFEKKAHVWCSGN